MRSHSSYVSSAGQRAWQPSGGTWSRCVVLALRAVRGHGCSSPGHDELHGEVARAELAGRISELHALGFHAILAMAEGSEFASDYLDMAELVASSPCERAAAAEWRATHDWLQANPLAVTECCHAIGHHDRTVALGNDLLIALCRLGERETIGCDRLRDTQAACDRRRDTRAA
jgi:hypothetical protein